MTLEKTTQKFQKELNAGAISLVLLCVLKRQGEPMYGYEIAKRLEEQRTDSMPMNQGAIYPVLRSLERQGLLQSQKVPSDSGPPRKYYQVTASGDQALQRYQDIWSSTTQFVNSFLEVPKREKSNAGNRALPSRARKVREEKKRSHS